MNLATLQAFRDLATQMIGTADWQWVGPHMSQRMFGITQERAEGYAKAHGGTAEQMVRDEDRRPLPGDLGTMRHLTGRL